MKSRGAAALHVLGLLLLLGLDGGNDFSLEVLLDHRHGCHNTTAGILVGILLGPGKFGRWRNLASLLLEQARGRLFRGRRISAQCLDRSPNELDSGLVVGPRRLVAR